VSPEHTKMSFLNATNQQDVDVCPDKFHLYETGTCRTIHKSKGDEFECVLVVLEARRGSTFNENTGLSFLLNPNLLSNEEHRVNYVALSRAQNHLYISTPTLSAANETFLRALDVEVERLP